MNDDDLITNAVLGASRALVAMAAVWYLVQQARYFPAFAASSLMILLLLIHVP